MGKRSIQDSQKTGYSLARGLLEKENYQVEEINLLSGTGLPGGDPLCGHCRAEETLFPGRNGGSEKISFSGGGRVILMLEPYQDGGLKEWLASLGVTLDQDIVIDKVSRIFGGDYLIPMAGSYGQHPITEKFNVATFFPTARSLTIPPPHRQVFFTMFWFASSSESWAETDKRKMEKGEAAFDAGKDRKGPLPLAVLVTLASPDQKTDSKESGKKEKKLPKGQIALFGDSDFAANGYFNLSGNGDLFLNTINYPDRRRTLISIRPAKTPVRPLSLTSLQAQILFLGPHGPAALGGDWGRNRGLAVKEKGPVILKKLWIYLAVLLVVAGDMGRIRIYDPSKNRRIKTRPLFHQPATPKRFRRSNG